MHHSITLNEHRFYVRRMPPFVSLAVLADLQKSLLSPLIKGMSGKPLETSTQVTEALISGLEGMSGTLGSQETIALAKMLLNPEYLSVEIRLDNGTYAPAEKVRDAQIDLTLRGVADLLTLCVEVVKVNYSDFLEPLAPLISSARSLAGNKLAGSLKN